MIPQPPSHRPTLSRRGLIEAASLGAFALAKAGPSLTHAATGTPTADVPSLVAATTGFALKLYAQLRQGAGGNLVFSPYSISEALAMVYAGARGETAAQMARTLGFGASPAVDAAFAALNADLVARAQIVKHVQTDQPRGLRLANALWGEQGYPFSQAYTAELAHAYGAGLQLVDFAQAEQARTAINAWVAAQTNDRIKEIAPPGFITAMTRMVLANAIWFAGAWASPFSPKATQDGPFHRLDGTEATVPFMEQEHFVSYWRGEGVQAVEFPFDGSGFAFTVILPDAETFDAVETQLDMAMLTEAIGQLAWTKVRVFLPKFKFDFGAVDLTPLLRALGMADVFDAAKANLSGMVQGPPPEPLMVSGVLHKAFVSVDENGAEAAAATVQALVGALLSPEPEPPEVRVDRPFLFAIRDTETGKLLFLGRVLDPSAESPK